MALFHSPCSLLVSIQPVRVVSLFTYTCMYTYLYVHTYIHTCTGKFVYSYMYRAQSTLVSGASWIEIHVEHRLRHRVLEGVGYLLSWGRLTEHRRLESKRGHRKREENLSTIVEGWEAKQKEKTSPSKRLSWTYRVLDFLEALLSLSETPPFPSFSPSSRVCILWYGHSIQLFSASLYLYSTSFLALACADIIQ